MDNSLANKVSVGIILLAGLLSGCSSHGTLPSATLHPSNTENINTYKYLIGSGDVLNIFVWRHPDISGLFNVRPDGMITTSLAEDIKVSGKTPTELARSIEDILAAYIRDPMVTVTVENFVGPFSEQIRVIGEAAQPRAINYTQHMTLLDVMIQVGGLTEFADGNDAVLIRIVNGKQQEYSVMINELLKDGEISANVDMLPGDIIIIPEAWF